MSLPRILLPALTLSLLAGGTTGLTLPAQGLQAPFDLFGAPIDNRQVYRHFERTATRMMQEQAAGAVESLQRRLRAAPRSAEVVPELDGVRPEDRAALYEHMVKATVYIGELYNCGRCDRTHAGFSGGVVISPNGLVLTNYHVMEARESGKSEGFYAMSWDGRCWEIDQVLAASKNDDIALVRLKSGDHPFYAAPIADQAPRPMDPVRIVSHPYGEFFVMTHGEVSRYARMRTQRDKSARERAVWMEVTTPFGSGSSGCGVFNEQGEVVGLVSSIRPLFRNSNRRSTDDQKDDKDSRSRYVEMLIRKCVPLSAIHDSLE